MKDHNETPPHPAERPINERGATEGQYQPPVPKEEQGDCHYSIPYKDGDRLVCDVTHPKYGVVDRILVCWLKDPGCGPGGTPEVQPGAPEVAQNPGNPAPVAPSPVVPPSIPGAVVVGQVVVVRVPEGKGHWQRTVFGPEFRGRVLSSHPDAIVVEEVETETSCIVPLEWVVDWDAKEAAPEWPDVMGCGLGKDTPGGPGATSWRAHRMPDVPYPTGKEALQAGRSRMFQPEALGFNRFQPGDRVRVDATKAWGVHVDGLLGQVFEALVVRYEREEKMVLVDVLPKMTTRIRVHEDFVTKIVPVVEGPKPPPTYLVQWRWDKEVLKDRENYVGVRQTRVNKVNFAFNTIEVEGVPGKLAMDPQIHSFFYHHRESLDRLFEVGIELLDDTTLDHGPNHCGLLLRSVAFLGEPDPEKPRGFKTTLGSPDKDGKWDHDIHVRGPGKLTGPDVGYNGPERPWVPWWVWPIVITLLALAGTCLLWFWLRP